MMQHIVKDRGGLYVKCGTTTARDKTGANFVLGAASLTIAVARSASCS